MKKEKVRGYKIDGKQVFEGDLLIIPIISNYIQSSFPGYIDMSESELVNLTVEVFYNEEELQWQIKSLSGEKYYEGENFVLLKNFPIAFIGEYEEKDFDENGYLHDDNGNEVCSKNDDVILKIKFAKEKK